MLIKVKRGWEMPESQATPEDIYLRRREFAKVLAAGPILAASAPLLATAAAAATDDPTADLYPAQQNETFELDRQITEEEVTTTFNNFFEFGSHKRISKAAQKLETRPWTVKIDGLVENEMEVGIDDLIRAMPIEERLYRHRCVEAWSIAVPWTGFPVSALLDFAKPLGSAKYVHMITAMDERSMTGLRQFWYPWPYVEGLTMAEAANDVAFMTTGAYGKPALPQNGAPLRLSVPWKYGFKSVKSIARIHFSEERPTTFWEKTGPTEYGFWANVNPEVPHPRWSQAQERFLTAAGPIMMPTQLYNGYGEFVASLYDGLQDEPLFM